MAENEKCDVLRLVEQQERERLLKHPEPPEPPQERPTIHWTELPEDTSGGRIAKEWNFYRTQVGRLLAEGHEGRWVLVKGEEIIGIWDTEKEANQVRVQKFLMQDVLIHQILEREPLLRGPIYFRLCPS
jgi:hypothetical protein